MLTSTLRNSFKRSTGILMNGFKNNTCSAVNMSSEVTKFKTLAVTVPKPFVYHVELNRPDKLNAMDGTMWREYGQCFDELSQNEDCRVIVVSGAGKLFCAGIDIKDLMNMAPKLAEAEDIARKAKILNTYVKIYQYCFTSMEVCPKPVISAVHSACVGAGVDLITATDIRYCSKDAWFQVKEVDIGMAADVGTLQRLPKVIGSDSLVRELCYTGRKLKSDEALSSGLVSRVFEDKASLIGGAMELAEQIAAKSPVAVQATKSTLVYARDHTVQEGLNQIGTLNTFLLQSDDFVNAVMAAATKSDPTFSKL